MGEWIVYDPLDADTRAFGTEQEAVDHATHLIETYLDDSCWAEEVLGIYVARRTHTVRRNVLGVRSEMSDDEWEALTNGRGDEADEWWDHDLVPILQPTEDQGPTVPLSEVHPDVVAAVLALIDAYGAAGVRSIITQLLDLDKHLAVLTGRAIPQPTERQGDEG